MDRQTFRFGGNRPGLLESAGQEKEAQKRIGIPAELYEDEAVCFIAGRYHTVSRKVIQRFLVQEGIVSEAEKDAGTFRLEENEMEILRALICGSHSQ